MVVSEKSELNALRTSLTLHGGIVARTQPAEKFRINISDLRSNLTFNAPVPVSAVGLFDVVGRIQTVGPSAVSFGTAHIQLYGGASFIIEAQTNFRNASYVCLTRCVVSQMQSV